MLKQLKYNVLQTFHMLTTHTIPYLEDVVGGDPEAVERKINSRISILYKVNRT